MLQVSRAGDQIVIRVHDGQRVVKTYVYKEHVRKLAKALEAEAFYSRSDEVQVKIETILWSNAIFTREQALTLSRVLMEYFTDEQ